MGDNQMHFKVMWKFKGKESQKADYITDDLQTLLTSLNKSEGVNKDSVECLFVHIIHPDNTVQELIAWDVQIPKDEQENVTSIVDHVLKKISKPRVRLKLPPPEKYNVVALGLYKVYEAK